MALNIQTFKTRAITALIFVLVVLGGLFLGFIPFLILFTVIHFGCWYEFVKLLRKINPQKIVAYLPLGLLYITMPCLMMIHLGVEVNLPAISKTDDAYFTNLSFIAVNYSPLYPCAILFSIWINDTMAYIVGSLIGKTPFSKISPKKTWEGTSGGVILCIITIGLLGYFVEGANYIQPIHWIFIAAICAIFGTAGDLLESKIKRMADVKDSGSIMPGHGGFLDRFDSLLVATPFVWLYVELFV